MGGNKSGKKSGGSSSKGKGANKQNQCNDKRCPKISKEKSTTCIPEVSSTSTNGVTAKESISVPATTPQNETMELDAPAVVEHKNKNQKPESSNKNKNSTKFLPTQITFGRHTASRTFKSNYSFGLAKPKPVNVPLEVGGGSNSVRVSKTEMDMSDIKDVLPISTDSAVGNEQT